MGKEQQVEILTLIYAGEPSYYKALQTVNDN